MKKEERILETNQENTWCPGCLNFVTLAVLKKVLKSLNDEKKIDLNSVVLVTDIGCAAKIYDYLNVNSVYALHGRVLPVATGIKAASPRLTVIGFGGDGGTYSEGTNHLIHSARRNVGVTMIVANNRVFALTKGQPTATNEETGNELDGVSLAKQAGATFAANASALDAVTLEKIIRKAIMHKGFSLVDIIQPCLIFKNDMDRVHAETNRIKNLGIPKEEKRTVWEEAIRKGMASSV